MSSRGLARTDSKTSLRKETASDVRVRQKLCRRRRGLPSSVSPRRGSDSRVQLRAGRAAILTTSLRTRIFLDNSADNLFASDRAHFCGYRYRRMRACVRSGSAAAVVVVGRPCCRRSPDGSGMKLENKLQQSQSTNHGV